MVFSLTSFSLWLALLTPLCNSAELLNSVKPFQNLQYVNLPTGLCNGLSASILWEVNGKEYSGLICDRDNSSHIFLQKLVSYTSNGKAIWQIVSVETLPKPKAGELLVNAGCFDKNDKSKPIIALVKDLGSQPYKIVRAWETNLIKEKFEEINSTQVVCYDPFVDEPLGR
ncbi:hypothetical protein Cri9333_0025 [Crinalium epipsammum PCC 9333]|uniref:Uncharacterized protein n=1 Tax=Crinalium epipsammum PCC 9333 TaxID=1173022 RepID=K9VU04_9CYAN|nr:hypothetical protein [Crinalium epipsammum]AFZ11029.1 hypothetical protein Cri9333_0025 [Crinalium epipsammum PCC 9333]